jgi:eukaryotic-like serine/threonine-protein kinase
VQFGKYDLTRKIATGGMAETWLGSFTGAAGVTKTVVLKRIRPELADDPEFVRMFVNEARIAASLSHGNIAQVFDFGEVDGEYFLAMEFVDGPTLSKVLKRGAQAGLPALPIPFALYVAVRMCEGLHYAHTRTGPDGKRLAFIHRDVSPQNVIVGFEGEVKLIDFGIAKAVTDTRDFTQPGVWKGKLLYASPEQMKIDPLDARTDVYSTGIVLYEMLCGALPFGGQHAGEVLVRIEKGDFKRPLEVNSDIPKPVEDAVLVAMAPNREDRFPDAHAMQDALQRLLYGIAPGFNAATMGQLMAWLYADDLKKRGSRVDLPQGFVDQLSMWRRAATSRNTGEVERTDPRTVAERSKHRTRAPTYQQLTRATDQQSKAPRAMVLIAVAVVIALAAIFTTGAWVQMSKARLQVTSDPPGATVTIGGVPQAQVTPLDVKVTPNEALDV